MYEVEKVATSATLLIQKNLTRYIFGYGVATPANKVRDS